jgi:light-regulated signal transduction histidine kinase (bacteriophytochrome)
MDPDRLSSLQNLCRNEAAFEQLQRILVAEIQPLEQAVRQAQLQVIQQEYQVAQQRALFQVITRLRQSIDLETLFKATATEVRQMLKADRVGMFRFHPDSGWDDGEFVSEDVDPEFSSAIAEKVHDHCFGEQFMPLYQQGRVQAVADIYGAGLSDCHIQILAQFQVRANLAVPLLQGTHLWGLLCIHQCRAPREWQPQEIEFATQIASHLGVALQHAELLVHLRSEVIERQQAQEQAQALNQGLQTAIVELKAVNKELEAFSYSVSHDLRAPLRSIDGFSQALLEDYLAQLDAPGQDYLRRIRSASQRMGQLIDDLLNLSRVTRSSLKLDPVDLSRIASRICTDLQQRSPDRLVEFVIKSDLQAQGDAQLIYVLLENLLNNAWKFSAKKTPVQIEFGCMSLDEARREGGPNLLPAQIAENSESLVYFVRDNGSGFDMAYVHKLFSPFQRLHGMQEFPGNGIGLATVQRIVHRHGGQVWAIGAIDHGATVYFTLAPGRLTPERLTAA